MERLIFAWRTCQNWRRNTESVLDTNNYSFISNIEILSGLSKGCERYDAMTLEERIMRNFIVTVIVLGDTIMLKHCIVNDVL